MFFFFLNDPATTEISPLPLHDALPISLTANRWNDDDKINFSHALPRRLTAEQMMDAVAVATGTKEKFTNLPIDRKSTRLNSSHSQISYAVFCLKKKSQHTASGSRPHRH